MKISEWGAVMRLARRAASLATEDTRLKGKITDPLESSIAIYTDCPVTAGIFYRCGDMAAICKTSAIEFVATVMGDKFPGGAFEADRDDLEMPRVAAMFFPSPGTKCPRCRNYTVSHGEVCAACKERVK